MQSTILLKYISLLFYSTFMLSCLKVKPQPKPVFYVGGDLSYVNEMQDCGGVFRENQKPVNPYQFFHEKGSNIVRLRLWHTPTFTTYSILKDVEKSIIKSKAEQQTVLLDFHYSDDWADPSKQVMPKAWQNIKSRKILLDSLHNYTYNTLKYLNSKGLLPEIVQIGNETNIEIVQHPDSLNKEKINWSRNAQLFNAGIQAVKKFNKDNATKVETMLHIAQPENAEPWFQSAALYDVVGYDWIGLSYYPKWSKYDLSQLETTMKTLKTIYKKRVMIVETAYPYTSRNFDQANNMLDAEAKLANYPVTPEGQLSFMLDLKGKCINAGAEGIIYWEPAWISTKCKTQWGQGSHWENAIFFDAANNNEALPVFKFLKPTY
jgi:arabinogalactan endo-1,4-beta-galactosidase